jgi:hypothetical protein
VVHATEPKTFELVEANDVPRAARIFRRDGFVALVDVLSESQLQLARRGADRVITEQVEATVPENANRGFARYSFGPQHQHPEWSQLIDLPPLLRLVEAIWESPDFLCSGAGGDYSLPGAQIQHLHSDIGDVLNNPQGRVTIQDLPTPFIVINLPMVDFRRDNGATRFIPCTHRERNRPPSLEEEPDWMKESILCAPAGSAVLRDVRCRHGGTANVSDEIRAMTSVGYYAPWFRRPGAEEGALPVPLYEALSARGRVLCRHLVRRAHSDADAR